jgi:hypothetical protein
VLDNSAPEIVLLVHQHNGNKLALEEMEATAVANAKATNNSSSSSSSSGNSSNSGSSGNTTSRSGSSSCKNKPGEFAYLARTVASLLFAAHSLDARYAVQLLQLQVNLNTLRDVFFTVAGNIGLACTGYN